MGEKVPPYAMTRGDYEAFEAEHGHSPTQDPVYNHSAGDPEKRETPKVQPTIGEARALLLEGEEEDFTRWRAQNSGQGSETQSPS